ncbi:hypothetical protein D3C73_825590 [compost metagenome]
MDQLGNLMRVIVSFETQGIAGIHHQPVQITAVQAFGLFGPDAKCTAQRARESAQMAKIRLSDHTRPISSQEGTAFFDILLNPFAVVLADQIQHGSDHQLIGGEVFLRTDNIDRNAQLPQCLIMLKHRFFIFQAGVADTLGILNRPAVVPVIYNSGLHRCGCAYYVLQLCEGTSNFRNIAEDTGFGVAAVVYHGTVEFLAGTAAFAPLKVLDRV